MHCQQLQAVGFGKGSCVSLCNTLNTNKTYLQPSHSPHSLDAGVSCAGQRQPPHLDTRGHPIHSTRAIQLRWVGEGVGGCVLNKMPGLGSHLQSTLCFAGLLHAMASQQAGTDFTDDEDVLNIMQIWQSHDYDSVPEDFIPCPLSEQQLREFYSLDRLAHEQQIDLILYRAQEHQLRQFLGAPKPSQQRKRGRSGMQPLTDPTINTRLGCINEYVGFAAKWQGEQPTMELVMQPQLLSKYGGFMLAKKLGYSTIMKNLSQLKLAVDFINSTAYTGGKGWEEGDAAIVKDWIASKISQLKWQSNNSTLPSTQTLFQVWEHHTKKWNEFKEAFKVSRQLASCGVCACMCGVCLA